MSNTNVSPTRVAVVTGAAQGIGEATALRLARDGYDVAVSDLPQKREKLDAVVKAIEATGRRATSVSGDASVEADVARLIEQAVQELGGVDVMVANAGMFKAISTLEQSVDEFDKVLAVNTRSVFLAIKHAGAQMVKQGRGGRIIAAASTAGIQGIKYSAAYSASKFAVRGLVQSAALEFRQHNITVNAYAPGLIITEMIMHPDDEKNGGPGSTGLKLAGLPAGSRGGQPEDVAGLVAYLARPEAWYITGQSIPINGGFAMH